MGVSQVKPSNCFRLHTTSMISEQWNSYREIYGSMICLNNPSSWQPVQAPRKISYTLHFWNKSFIIDDVKLIQQQFWMKECDSFGDRNILWHIFTGQDPNPRIYAPDRVLQSIRTAWNLQAILVRYLSLLLKFASL